METEIGRKRKGTLIQKMTLQNSYSHIHPYHHGQMG